MKVYELAFAIAYWKQQRGELNTETLVDIKRVLDAKNPFEEFKLPQLLTEEEEKKIEKIVEKGEAGELRNYDAPLALAIGGKLDQAVTTMEVLGSEGVKKKLSPDYIQERIAKEIHLLSKEKKGAKAPEESRN